MISQSCKVRDGVRFGVIGHNCRVRYEVSGGGVSHTYRIRNGDISSGCRARDLVIEVVV